MREPLRTATASRSPSSATETLIGLKFTRVGYEITPRSAKLCWSSDARPLEHGDGVVRRIRPSLDDGRDPRPHLTADETFRLDAERARGGAETSATELAGDGEVRTVAAGVIDGGALGVAEG